MSLMDWAIIGGFFTILVVVSVYTNRLTRSVAGFLTADRCAGRYLLTIAGGMAFCAAVGIVGQWEAGLRNGITRLWWMLMFIPLNMIVAMSGWVTYRYRETRAMTMGQFMGMRYSSRFRIFSGIMAFISGVLNCAIFPMVTGNFLMWFLGLPKTFEWIGLTISTHTVIMLVIVGTALTLALAGGQITIMVTDFFQGMIANVACMAMICFVVWKFGIGTILDTLMASETADVTTNPEMLTNLDRVAGTSMLHPFKIGKVPDFGIPFFIMLAFQVLMQTGVWQGGAGYLTAARTPHESKMGNTLSHMRFLIINVGVVMGAVLVYVVMWNPDYASLREPITSLTRGIEDPTLQSQVFVPVALSKILPAGLLGLIAAFMIGASVSTDDSYYHSWGSTFLQDVVMPFRKKPFTPEQHLRYLRWSICGVAAFVFFFSSVWTLKDFIQMWFSITASIYVGGACCAVVGGLYWKKGTTQGAWAGMITGSVLAVAGIVLKQIWPYMAIGGVTVNSQHMGVFTILVAITVYVVVSLLTCREPYNLDRLLHRGEYALEGEHNVKAQKRSVFQKMFGITSEFSPLDKVIFGVCNIWVVGWGLVFIIGTLWNVTHEVPSSAWKVWWHFYLVLAFITAGIMTIWFGIGSIRDVLQLFRDLRTRKEDYADDGTLRDERKADTPAE